MVVCIWVRGVWTPRAVSGFTTRQTYTIQDTISSIATANLYGLRNAREARKRERRERDVLLYCSPIKSWLRALSSLEDFPMLVLCPTYFNQSCAGTGLV